MFITKWAWPRLTGSCLWVWVSSSLILSVGHGADAPIVCSHLSALTQTPSATPGEGRGRGVPLHLNGPHSLSHLFLSWGPIVRTKSPHMRDMGTHDTVDATAIVAEQYSSVDGSPGWVWRGGEKERLSCFFFFSSRKRLPHLERCNPRTNYKYSWWLKAAGRVEL